MKIALCNEVLKEMELAEQCRFAAGLGYDGLELAPFTLFSDPEPLTAADRRRIRRCVNEAGLKVAGLHWLLVSPPGLSITSPDSEVRERTLQILLELVDLCADLGGDVLVHGSPRQRQVGEDEDPSEAWQRSREIFQKIARRAEAAQVTYCLEPLPRAETNFINRLEEAVQMVREVGSPALKTMLDTKAAWTEEKEAPEELLSRWLPAGLIGHVHVNTADGRAPGQDATSFGPILRTLVEHDYSGWVSVEPFQFIPSPQATAAQAAGYLRGLCEAGL